MVLNVMCYFFRRHGVLGLFYRNTNNHAIIITLS